MTFIEKLSLIERIDQLIKMKCTGNSIELSNRLGIGRSTLFELIELMKLLGAEIKYCQHRRSFVYTEEKILSIGFVRKDRIKGGKKNQNYFFESGFFGLLHHTLAFETFQKGDSEPS